MDRAYSREGYLVENYRYFHLRDTAGQERDFHFHDFDKLVIMLEGKVRYLMETEDYQLHARDILLVRHHCIHKAMIDRSEPYERIILYLDRGYFDRLIPDTRLMDCFDRADQNRRHLLQPDPDQWASLSSLFLSFEENCLSDAMSSAMRDTLVMQILITIARLSPVKDSPLPSLQDDKISDTLSYIAENLRSDLSIEFLSERVWLSRYHFMRLFKLQTGQSVHAYIRQKRLLYAARLIREGVTVSEAAHVSGFHDYSGFHRAFLDTFGCTPGRLKGKS